MGKGGHEHNENSLRLPRRHAAAEAAEAAAPEATEAATAAPRRIARRRARYAVDARSRVPRAFQARPALPIYSRIMLARPRTLPTGFIAPYLPTEAAAKWPPSKKFPPPPCPWNLCGTCRRRRRG